MVYKIRVILDAKDDVFRDIEIRGKQTLWNLHLGIKNAFSLQGEELSAFNLLEDDGTIIKSVPLEDMSDEGDGEIMSDVYINEAFSKVGDKAQFQYGFIDLWEFLCELVSIDDAKPSVQYPITVYRFGNVSLKSPNKGVGASSKAKTSDFDADFHINELGDMDFFDEEDSYDDEEDNGYDVYEDDED